MGPTLTRQSTVLAKVATRLATDTPNIRQAIGRQARLCSYAVLSTFELRCGASIYFSRQMTILMLIAAPILTGIDFIWELSLG
ncbi:unnamed protein product, partial [Mesorhabditis belari]|uniref:Uncharacterized protein n=1 Tax=Mesorhabditis belari TaxID=2138241 RepID=A0AAF3F8T5_9BILA